ncbi:membrane protein [Lacticaseibacillus rhamnosus MTCC 5462]|nr:membrane protein [Lacticaseibacillus rhamnosus MTCC 5462]
MANFIYPNVIGRSLDIHPLTIIYLLMVAGNLWGLLGTILAVPTYAVIKTVITYLYELYRFTRSIRMTRILMRTMNCHLKPRRTLTSPIRN